MCGGWAHLPMLALAIRSSCCWPMAWNLMHLMYPNRRAACVLACGRSLGIAWTPDLQQMQCLRRNRGGGKRLKVCYVRAGKESRKKVDGFKAWFPPFFTWTRMWQITSQTSVVPALSNGKRWNWTWIHFAHLFDSSPNSVSWEFDACTLLFRGGGFQGCIISTHLQHSCDHPWWSFRDARYDDQVWHLQQSPGCNKIDLVNEVNIDLRFILWNMMKQDSRRYLEP